MLGKFVTKNSIIKGEPIPLHDYDALDKMLGRTPPDVKLYVHSVQEYWLQGRAVERFTITWSDGSFKRLYTEWVDPVGAAAVYEYTAAYDLYKAEGIKADSPGEAVELAVKGWKALGFVHGERLTRHDADHLIDRYMTMGQA